ncbi:TIGR02680 family protein [Radiobacillus kanasensis]|uniref:TIGR02680 family protein n=1 Tax=Radiobacillus kanasensis TaxID=2844358 RepID=UPI001E36466E|nr:TIGR02680 family protein [Radiobacillus kanasensis]UFU00259.1 TIGR02680 family protein [Radiobacillus kanasensis]
MNKWKMNSAGLLNFWYYDEETFTFSDGKLLLRGSNGSGKSVTMQSFLPVLLDGKTSPDRLDPFGSKARRMEDYLLGEKDIVNRDERTGYLFLEFKRQGTDQYITIGIGLQAKRNKQMKFWGFVVTDNQRIGHDIKLYKIENNAGEKQKIPLSRVELENLIGDGGHVVQTKTEYMKLVNKYLFGFETVEAYEDLIKLLIQLRSPKLSKDFRPTVIYEILEAALPPLSDEDLRHLSDTIEQMDQTKQQIEQLDREATAISSLNQVYHTYNQRILADHADEYVGASKRLAKEQKEYKQWTEKLTRLDQEIDQLNEEIRDLSLKQVTNKKQEERLKSHKVWNLEKELRDEKEKLQSESEVLRRKTGHLQDRREKENKLRIDKNQLEELAGERKEEMEDKLLDMTNDVEDSSFVEAHELNKQDFERHIQERFDFSVWKKETDHHISNLEKIEEELRKFDQLKAKYQEKDKVLADEKKVLDEITYQEQEWTRLFEEDKEQKLNEIHTWLRDSEWLTIQGEALQETSRSIHSLYEPTSYESVKEPFRQAILEFERNQGQLLSEMNFKRDNLVREIERKETELQEWNNKKDPEPITDSLTKEARQQLDANAVPYIPFYAAVEFQDHVDLDVRKRIESAIMDSGMLDALIMESNLKIEHDRILIPAPNMMAYTLADYLKPDLGPDHNISASLVDEVLRSIIIGEEESSTFSISDQGHYQIGLLKGHALPVNDVRYIGRSARRRFREEQIALIQGEIEALYGEKQLVTNEIRRIESTISQAKLRFERFPNDLDLQEVFRDIKDARVKINIHKSRVQHLSEELKDIHTNYTQVKSLIDEQTRKYNLEVSLISYQKATSVAKRYEKDLSDLEKEHIQYVNDVKRKEEILGRIDEIEQDMIEIQGEINISRDLVEGLKQNIQRIEQQLEQQGVGDIRKQIYDVQQALKEIDVALEEKKTTKPRKETEQEHVNHDIGAKDILVHFWTNMKETWEDSFKQEVLRGFVEQEKQKEIHEIAEDVLKEYGHLIREKDRSKLASQLTQEFYKQQSDLMEYRATSFNAPFTSPTWMNEVVEEEQKPHIEKWKQKMSRQLIELNYQGKQVSPYTVQQQIDLEQARQESFLDEQDQALYEEILFNSVGQKLRARIRRAEQWVGKMKSLMESRDTSSGLSFSIKWKPRTADSETEMDTVDLVHLLRQDPKLLKEEDLEKITVHFRSKIAKAKEMMGESSELQTLLQVLKEVLDYRKWFSFILYFQREGEKKRELTNNQFYKFSGGEKAMAMYIPLFTACYSRYSEADNQAPYIISLDEAFAGVDENNIREMFEIVEQLGFDYIMNSQVLWGDYDTISELSISELIRPKNADFVSVIRYHWDGNKMDLEVPTEIEDETLV